MAPTLRQKLGCWLHERWKTELVLRLPGMMRACGVHWQDLSNRNETLAYDKATGGRICHWQDSSRLTVVRMFPDVGRRLLVHVLRDWPVRLRAEDASTAAGEPEVSILIPIGGSGRLPQFHLALAAARAQIGVSCEVVVVEQGSESILDGQLPHDVRYLYQPSAPGDAFNKAKAFNAAARMAAGRCLILLDADMLMPTRFAAECVRALGGAEAVRPVRWIFHCSREASERLAKHGEVVAVESVEDVISNNPTPLAIWRDTYWAVGGHDEDYAGWGGEDSEFLDRLRTRNLTEGGWLPVLHAWHAPAPSKSDGSRNSTLHAAKMGVPATSRIERLRRNCGLAEVQAGESGWQGGGTPHA